MECKLPADAKYFAINYVSRDMFGILVDDVNFVSATEMHSIAKYNVYRDGLLIGDTTTPEYLDDAVEDGNTYRYHVTTVTEKESAASAQASITVSKSGIHAVAAPALSITVSGGNIVVTNAGDSLVAIHSADGKTLWRGTGDGSHPMAPGAYIVTAAGTTVKVLVR